MRNLALTLIASALTTTSLAEPIVFDLPGEDDDSIIVNDPMDGLPDFRVWTDTSGNGVTLDTLTAPFIFEWPVGSGNGSVYEVQSPDTVYMGYYPDFPGMVVDANLPGWFNLERGRDSYSTSLPLIYSTGDSQSQCTGTDNANADIGEVYYFPFRIKEVAGTDWHYGWAAFRIFSSTSECCLVPGVCDTIINISIDYQGFAIESDPNTPIIIGGGLCPADLNFDAQLDFFDLSVFIQALGNQEEIADVNEDGQYDFFDVSEFLQLMTTPCFP